MNFVQNLEECLRDLAAASRQRHPGVKEASERAVMKLRMLQNKYVSAVRQASSSQDHPKTTLFQSSDLLHPFLLAANYPNADYKLLEIALRAMRLLMEADAIVPTDGIHMVRVYQIQAQVVTSQYQAKHDKQPPQDSQNSSSHASSSWFGWNSKQSSVSSSTGQTGQAAHPHMDQLALELLSSLLQLLELLRNYDVSVELWTNSMSVAAQWLFLPPSHTVHQAAATIVSQICSLIFDYYESDSKFIVSTWDDLLLIVCDSRKRLTGAFKMAVISPTLALQLMTNVWCETNVLKTMGVTMKLLQQQDSDEQRCLRVTQWTYMLLETSLEEYPTECTELLSALIQPILQATESCRSQHEFEDGFIYEGPLSEENVTRQTFMPKLPRAAFVLEVIYHLLDNEESYYYLLSLSNNLIEALSDFATIATSCKDHMLQVVDFDSSGPPTVIRRAEQGSLEDVSLLGESVWLALRGILRIVEELPGKELRRDSFSPALAVFQHILKRFVGSEDLVELALEGYSFLAAVFLPLDDRAMERKVLLTSLCKLSLPQWGKHDANSLLHDHHVRSLLCLLRIVHIHYDFILSEWEIVMWTFEELSVLEISSPNLTEKVYHSSLAIVAIFGRLAKFSTCLTDESLVHLAQALAEICLTLMAKRDVVGDSETVLPERLIATDDRSSVGERAGIGGKIMSMSARVLYGNASNDGDNAEDTPRPDRVKKSYYQDYRSDFVARLGQSNSTIRIHAVGRTPFALVLLTDLCIVNLFRPSGVENEISRLFSGLATTSQAIRPYVMDVTTMLTMNKLSSDWVLPLTCNGPGKTVFADPTHSQLLAAEYLEPASDFSSNRQDVSSQSDVLFPICNTIRTTSDADVARSTLEVLCTVLEGTGQSLRGDVWSLLIDTIASLSGDSLHESNRTTTDWSAGCLIAFRTLKLIVDDFLDALPKENGAHGSLLECCSSFVSSRHDINTSLTAIGLLWSIADHDADAERTLSKLVLLSSDDRLEVRNAAVNAFFSCIAGLGANFSGTEWQFCITKLIFRVHGIVVGRLDNGTDDTDVADGSNEKKSRYEVRQHHTRDSANKMWLATLVLVLRGFTRVLRSFFDELLASVDDDPDQDSSSTSWFEGAWEQTIGFAVQATRQPSGRDGLNIRTAGAELLVVCCQLASKSGIQAAVTPARVGTNMAVVNGALRSVRESEASAVEREQRLSTESAERVRQKLYAKAFSGILAFGEETISRGTEDDSDMQVVTKFCTQLSSLYDCSHDNEFKVDNAARSLLSIDRLRQGVTNSADDSLESRFVQLVLSILNLTSGNPSARYLNQGQRASLDLLRAMASNGSSMAFECLVKLAGPAFFMRKEGDNEDSECSDANPMISATLMNYEAASVVSSQILCEEVSDECACYVILLVISDFLTDSKDTGRGRRYYKLFVPIMKRGLHSAARLASRQSDTQNAAVAKVWPEITKCFKQMLLPIPLGRELFKIARVSELMTMTTYASANVPPAYANDYAVVLYTGAAGALDSAKQHSITAESNPESDFGRKSKRHRDDLLKLFTTCFSGCCLLDPEGSELAVLARDVFDHSVSSGDETGSSSGSASAINLLYIDAGVLLCEAIQESSGMDTFTISVFPALCSLLMSTQSNPRLREAAGNLLSRTNIAQTLENARTRCRAAERRAEEAEQRARELSFAVDELQREKSQLQQAAAAVDAKKPSLWGLG